jgi:hypothetical protein
MYAKIQNNKIDKFPFTETDLKKGNPSTSFPINPLENTELREAFDVVEVQENPQPDFNVQTQKCIETTPKLKSGKWIQVWETKAKTSAEKTQDDSDQWAKVRNQRTQKLEETDWQMTKALETGEDASDLRTYRQKLRDIPQDQANPFSITWPEL